MWGVPVWCLLDDYIPVPNTSLLLSRCDERAACRVRFFFVCSSASLFVAGPGLVSLVSGRQPQPQPQQPFHMKMHGQRNARIGFDVRGHTLKGTVSR